MPCTSQPQMPRGLFGVIRQGPIAQMRQQVPTTEAAVRRLILDALLPAVGADLLAVFQQGSGGGLHLLYGNEAFLIHWVVLLY